MSWSIGFDDNYSRYIGYGVPSICDKPGCNERINRGVSYVCGGDFNGGDKGCGLYFCRKHLLEDRSDGPFCPRCTAYKPEYKHPSPDTKEWIEHQLTDESWQQWRDDEPELVKDLQEQLAKYNRAK